MQIAKVVPKVKTHGTGIFDYSIPAEILPEIRCGILVEVPFHNRNIEAIVIDIKRNSQIDVLKPILKIIDPNPVIDETHLRLAQWMSNYYLSPLSQTLFENVVPPAIRTIKKTAITKTPFYNEKRSNTNDANKKYLVVADFPRRLDFYLKAIEKTIKRKQSVIIIIPDLSLISPFSQKIKNIIILNADLTKTDRWLAWNKIRESNQSIVIGSNSALFAPVKNLGLIIVDQIENATYKNDRSPRFSTVLTAQKLASTQKSNLIFGSMTPDIETYYKIHNKFEIFKHEFKKPFVEITDVSNTKEILSATLKERLEETINKHQKSLIVLNRKGEGSFYACSDCNWIFKCPSCDLPLRPQGNNARCSHCEKNFPLPTNCPKCSGLNFKNGGIGTRRLRTILKQIFPQAKILNLEKDGDQLTHDFDIAIATTYALKLTLPEIDFVAIVNADSYMNLPDYRSSEEAFSTFYKFLCLTKNGLIQTAHPDDNFVKKLATLDFQGFTNEELKIREKNNFPPYVQMINLIYQNTDEKKCRLNSQKLAENLENITDENIDVLGPSPAFINKKLGKYRWQIIIKTKNNININLKDLLLKQKDWIIDVDPIDTI